VVLDPDAVDELHSWSAGGWCFMPPTESKTPAPPGPYITAWGQTFQPWRVYQDFNATMFVTFRPAPSGSTWCVSLPQNICLRLRGHSFFAELDSVRSGHNARVIVPSRCYFRRSKERPLDGVRITVKDMFDIAGFRTSLCNRAWEELYPPCAKTASCIQKLVDAGAIIVGKAKLQAMIIREEAMECVEFIAPFNPRGDGYQIPSGSSSGSCAGLASYDWLDFSIGSDSKHWVS
jgi:Amidase